MLSMFIHWASSMTRSNRRSRVIAFFMISMIKHSRDRRRKLGGNFSVNLHIRRGRRNAQGRERQTRVAPKHTQAGVDVHAAFGFNL